MRDTLTQEQDLLGCRIETEGWPTLASVRVGSIRAKKLNIAITGTHTDQNDHCTEIDVKKPSLVVN